MDVDLAMRRSSFVQIGDPVEIVPEKTEKNIVRQRIKTIFGVCFLLLILVVFIRIIKHYSQFESGRNFVLLNQQTDSFTSDGIEIDYQRLLVRNRYPFVLMLTVRLCKVESDAQQPKYTVLAKSQYTFSGKYSWYSGTYQAAFTMAASSEGRFYMTDFPFPPEDLTIELGIDTGWSDEDVFFPPENLPQKIVPSLTKAVKEGKLFRLSEISEDRKIPNRRDSHWFCALPGDNADKVLVITLTPLANYE